MEHVCFDWSNPAGGRLGRHYLGVNPCLLGRRTWIEGLRWVFRIFWLRWLFKQLRRWRLKEQYAEWRGKRASAPVG